MSNRPSSHESVIQTNTNCLRPANSGPAHFGKTIDEPAGTVGLLSASETDHRNCRHHGEAPRRNHKPRHFRLAGKAGRNVDILPALAGAHVATEVGCRVGRQRNSRSTSCCSAPIPRRPSA